MKIFYAEDDIMMQKVVIYSLIRLGHEVTTVDNGSEAMDVLQDEDFDFIILDVFMPHASGLDVAKFVRDDLKKSTPIIMLSRSGLEETVNKALEIGVNDYITKPFKPEVLYLKMKKLTGSTSA